MNKKKLISMVTALTLAAGGFGGYGSMVSAKTGVSSSDFTISDAYELDDEDSSLVSDSEEATLPEKLDLRDRGVVTPVKLQNPFGCCWAFGTIAASEISILSEMGKTYEETGLDLSEKHLAWFEYQYLDDPYSSQNGEGYHYDRELTSGAIMNQGGNIFYAGGLFSQGVGPVLESDYPYKGKNGKVDYYRDDDDSLNKLCYSASDDWSIDNSERNKKAYTLEAEYILNTQVDDNDTYVYDEDITNAVKKQLNLGRGVAVTYCSDKSSPNETGNQEYMNRDNWCQYTDKDLAINHDVCIVGYDDNYPKENFNSNHQPEADGAFLVKNSWGSGENEFPNRAYGNWGIEENGVNTGYFWLSYYDMSIGSFEIFDYDLSQSAEDTEIVDQYDYAANNCVTVAKTTKDCSMANNFTAQYNQELRAVSCTTGSSNVNVCYEVYLINEDSYGKLVATVNQFYDYAGYHRETLDTPVKLSRGQKYSIVVKETNESNNDEIIIGAQQINSDTSISSKTNGYVTTIVNEGESYLKYDGTWYDWTDVRSALNPYQKYGYDADNFCIKGYSVLLDSTDVSDHKMTLSQTSYTYDGSAKKPDVTVDGLTYGKDYTVTYSNNTKAGTACVTVKGTGNFTGTAKAYFFIVKKSATVSLKTPTWKKLVSGKKSFRAYWKKGTGITGYQIQYSQKKNMKKSKTATITSAKTVNKAIKKLSSKRVYYVRIRSYKKVDGKKVYSKWSVIKKVKTK